MRPIRTASSAAARAATSSHDTGAGSVSSTSPASHPDGPATKYLPNKTNGTHVSSAWATSSQYRWRTHTRRVTGRTYRIGATISATTSSPSPGPPLAVPKPASATASRQRTVTTSAVARRDAPVPSAAPAPAVRAAVIIRILSPAAVVRRLLGGTQRACPLRPAPEATDTGKSPPLRRPRPVAVVHYACPARCVSHAGLMLPALVPPRWIVRD